MFGHFQHLSEKVEEVLAAQLFGSQLFGIYVSALWFVSLVVTVPTGRNVFLQYNIFFDSSSPDGDESRYVCCLLIWLLLLWLVLVLRGVWWLLHLLLLLMLWH